MVGPLSPEQTQYLQKLYNLHVDIECKTRKIGQENYLLRQVKVWGSSPKEIASMQDYIDSLVNVRDALVKAFEAARFAEPSEPSEPS